MQPTRSTTVLRFGTFEVSFQSGELRKAGIRIKVQQQPLRLLQILIERPGEVVTREELRSQIWPEESFGDFDQAVNIAVAKLRSALGDSAEGPRFIETLPKRGYRFIAEVTSVDDSSFTKAITHGTSDSSQTAPIPIGSGMVIRPRRWRFGFLAVGAILVIGLAILTVWRINYRAGPTASIRSVAVLPLENLSGDPSQDYFADGMTDQLITDLAQISALRVISRTSVMAYKGARKPLPQIARELNVDAVIEGTVLRFGEQVRITAQLIHATDDRHLWADTYQGNVRDTLVLQKKVAQSIATRMRIELTPQEREGLGRLKIVDPEAYESYLKGRYFWNKRTGDGLKEAIQYFDQAIAKDPNYAPAYSGLADSYALAGDWQYGVMTTKQALPRAKAAAMKAIELDDGLSEAHTSLAFCLDGFDWNWDAADKEFRRAIELTPGYATAHHWYAWHLALAGRNSEAISEMKEAQNLDPLSLIINSDLAELLLIAGFPDQSIEQSRKAIELDPNFAQAHNQLGQAYLKKEMFGDAILELRKATQLSGNGPSCVANLAHALAASGQEVEAQQLLNDLKNRSSHGYPLASELAVVYTALGDKDDAMRSLEKGYEERFNPGVLLRPGYDSLRADPRFKDLQRRIGIPR
jgi:TolB-like protein/DNA-binding winged helix-turn-helix (wHTH) protein/Flp pilus assembly protein TadD